MTKFGITTYEPTRSRDKSYSIATSYLLGGPGSIIGVDDFLLLTAAYSTPHPKSAGAISAGLKRPSREAEHSLSFGANIKNGGAYLHSPVCLNGTVVN
jgi:hypothetical protein